MHIPKITSNQFSVREYSNNYIAISVREKFIWVAMDRLARLSVALACDEGLHCVVGLAGGRGVCMRLNNGSLTSLVERPLHRAERSC